MEETLGSRICGHRKRLSMTQDQLAEKLGVTAQAVSKWENDLSCPDISVLPKLAQIFGVSTDSLLGCETESIQPANRSEKARSQKHFNMHWDGGRLAGICASSTIALFGALYFVSQYLQLDHSFWDMLWPTALFGFGVFGIYPKFSFFRFGCGIFGAYFLLNRFIALPFQPKSGMVWAIIIVLLGLALLAESLRKPKKDKFSFSVSDEEEHENSYQEDAESFQYKSNFQDQTITVGVKDLHKGFITTAFGDYTVDLMQVQSLADSAFIDISASFGNLDLLVPKHFRVTTDTNIALAAFDIEGEPDPVCDGTLHLNIKVNFGNVTVKYI